MELVTIEKLVHGGFGLARTDKGVVFVEGVMPGEQVTIELLPKKNGMQLARLVTVNVPSSDRRVPPCSVANRCGGCDWLFITYLQQVACKETIIRDTFSRIGKIVDLPAFAVFSGEEFGYRMRAQIKIGSSGEGGFYRKRSNEMVPIAHCPLLVPSINVLLQKAAAKTGYFPAGCESIRCVAGDAAVASDPVIADTIAETTITCGKYQFTVSGENFFQGNRFLLKQLGMWGRQWCSGTSFVDLYGGTGFFTVFLAGVFSQALLIESDTSMAAQAKKNCLHNGINHCCTVAASAEMMQRYLPKVIDFLVVDPPRSGLSARARTLIANATPQKILYVSCDCATQARDVGFFVGQKGYVVRGGALFDLYPNTHHIETAVIMEKIR